MANPNPNRSRWRTLIQTDQYGVPWSGQIKMENPDPDRSRWRTPTRIDRDGEPWSGQIKMKNPDPDRSRWRTLTRTDQDGEPWPGQIKMKNPDPEDTQPLASRMTWRMQRLQAARDRRHAAVSTGTDHHWPAPRTTSARSAQSRLQGFKLCQSTEPPTDEKRRQSSSSAMDK